MNICFYNQCNWIKFMEKFHFLYVLFISYGMRYCTYTHMYAYFLWLTPKETKFSLFLSLKFTHDAHNKRNNTCNIIRTYIQFLPVHMCIFVTMKFLLGQSNCFIECKPFVRLYKLNIAISVTNKRID